LRGDRLLSCADEEKIHKGGSLRERRGKTIAIGRGTNKGVESLISGEGGEKRQDQAYKPEGIEKKVGPRLKSVMPQTREVKVGGEAITLSLERGNESKLNEPGPVKGRGRLLNTSRPKSDPIRA